MPTCIIHENVEIGENAVIGDYVIIGEPPRGLNPGDLPTKIGDNAVIRSHTVIYAGNVIGNNFETGHHVLIRESNIIGNDVSVGTNSVVEHHVQIGNEVRIHSLAFVPEQSVLEDGSWIGPGVTITNTKYPLSVDAKQSASGVRLRQLAKIGANATLLQGITVGERALVGAGSVVVKDVPDNTVVAGSPARKINDVENLPYRR